MTIWSLPHLIKLRNDVLCVDLIMCGSYHVSILGEGLGMVAMGCH